VLCAEEADFLGDKIAMMSGGRLRAMGTNLFLKNHFGLFSLVF
jgi:hypothetical protein